MKDILQNLEWTSIVSILGGALSALISIWIWKRKKNADNRLSQLVKNDQYFLETYNKQIDKIIRQQEKTKKNLTDEIDINSEYDLKSLEIKNESLKKELELLKLELLKREIKVLASSLKKSEMNEIVEALNQKSLKGQANYINQILHLSGSTEHVSYNE